ncbi:RHS repeat-associated core domain-containing protein [Streptomyces sp. NPDC007126]|uniref:RHS repeat-associated core domain-containing protein n=1 Tax=Streptomyces sp. NPDC007126 TaxID=3364774 RepID=UPI00367DF3A8
MGGESYYYLTDATGYVLGLVDDSGKRTHTYAYGPTGTPRGTTSEAVPRPFRCAGAYADPTGLYKMGHRYYDPALGRFTQPDPSGQESNPYLYANGDPINNADPSGLGFLSTAADWYGKVNDVKDGVEMMQAIGDGDYRKAYSKGMGMLAGAATGATCETFVVLAAPESAGASLAATAACAAGGEAAGEWAEPNTA